MRRKHSWLSFAKVQGLTDAINFENGPAKRMTAIHIFEARRLIVQLKSKQE